MYKRHWLYILIVAILLTSFGYFFSGSPEKKPVPDVVADEYSFATVPCWFDIPWPEEILCGELHTPASTGTFVLPVVKILDTSSDHRADPIIYLPGGPGGSARLDEEGIKHWLNWVRYANLGRDFILMDPRGVGRSRPALTCQAYDQYSLDVLRQNISQEQELVESYAIVEQCFKDLAQVGFTAEHYGTQRSAEDLRALMRLLSVQNPQYQHWNLLGVSYGTRLALAATHDFPAVRSLILDSIYPAGYGGLQTWPILFDQSLNRFLAWCATDADCKSANNHDPMIDQLMLALKSLREQPMQLTVPRWDGEAPVTLMLNDYRFLSVIFSSIYSQHDWVHIAPALEAVINQEGAGVQTLVESFINNALSDSFSGLVFMAVDCIDNPIQSQSDYQKYVALYPLFAEYMSELWRYQACHYLAAEANQGLKREALPKVPALLLAGTIDPITPLSWAETMHQEWPGSQLITLENIGHSVISSDACIHRHLREFLNTPEEPFTACKP